MQLTDEKSVYPYCMDKTTISHICNIGQKYYGNIQQASNYLGISRPTFYAWKNKNNNGVRKNSISKLENYYKSINRKKGIARAAAKHVLVKVGYAHLDTMQMNVTQYYNRYRISLSFDDITNNPRRFACVAVQLARPELSYGEAFEHVKRHFFKNRVRRPDYQLMMLASVLDGSSIYESEIKPILQPIYFKILAEHEGDI